MCQSGGTRREQAHKKAEKQELEQVNRVSGSKQESQESKRVQARARKSKQEQTRTSNSKQEPARTSKSKGERQLWNLYKVHACKRRVNTEGVDRFPL